MLTEIVRYLTPSIQALNSIQEVHGLAELMTIEEEGNQQKFPSVGDKHIDLDTKKSQLFFLLDGNVTRETFEDEFVGTNWKIRETYNLNAYLYIQGKEDINCTSKSQQVAWSVSKALTGKHKAFMSATGIDFMMVSTTATVLDKGTIWNELYSVSSRLKEDDILVEVKLQVEIEGSESCFVGDPCEGIEFVYDAQARQTFCQKVADCVGEEIEIEFLADGSQTYLFNGTVQTFNPLAKTLIGKRIKYLDGDGVRWSVLNSPADYSLNATTGLLTLAREVISGTPIYLTATTI